MARRDNERSDCGHRPIVNSFANMSSTSRRTPRLIASSRATIQTHGDSVQPLREFVCVDVARHLINDLTIRAHDQRSWKTTDLQSFHQFRPLLGVNRGSDKSGSDRPPYADIRERRLDHFVTIGAAIHRHE